MRLYVPGEVQREALAFPKPVVLWASPANAGALELANEIADAALKVIGGTGHMSPMEDAASWSSAVTTLWRE